MPRQVPKKWIRTYWWLLFSLGAYMLIRVCIRTDMSVADKVIRPLIYSSWCLYSLRNIYGHRLPSPFGTKLERE